MLACREVADTATISLGLPPSSTVTAADDIHGTGFATPTGREAQVPDRVVEWLTHRRLTGDPDEVLVGVVVALGWSKPFAEQVVREIAGSPVFQAAQRAYRVPAKVASLQRQLGELFKRTDFRIERRLLSPESFYCDFYFVNRPVVLTGLMDGWPALGKWGARYFKDRFGKLEVEIADGRDGDDRYEEDFLEHRRVVTMGEYVDMVTEGGATNDYYLVARNRVLDRPGFASLRDDFTSPPGFLDSGTVQNPFVRLWFGPAETLTPLHCDDRNVLFGQVVGRKLIKLIAPYFHDDLYNDRGCYSPVDLGAIDLARFPALRDVPIFEVVLEPGEFLFIPVGWWHWVRALEISVSLSFTNFHFDKPEIVWSQASA